MEEGRHAGSITAIFHMYSRLFFFRLICTESGNPEL